ncbi:acetate kinase [Actimicrobium sp. GrIS 1.19]|uniref:acetate/propionate family kinase n=1 Tax=Actimicrobium sp. GrIS 1.19 TaxID=3071708 RepID=UPI002E0B6979|nr:acetate kinase [Actimicrobium sp. GrIS 1.19]
MLDRSAQPAMQRDCLLVINAGSSSIKFSLLCGDTAESLETIACGAIEAIGSAPHFLVGDQAGARLAERRWDEQASHDALLGHLIDWIEAHAGPNRLIAAGHRVAHGGLDCVDPQRITPEVMAQLRALEPLAPMHQAHNLAPIDALARLHPGLLQVACFDTAFHATNPAITRMYGLPQALTDAGVRRFGFHGLSYEYIAGELPKHAAQPPQARTIVAHLGSGASMCAMVDGKSVASTMGFSALDGLLMGTRCGALDPGVVLYLLQEKGMSVGQVENMLYHDSGLLGVSGISNDVRTLLASDSAAARTALDLFVYRAARELGSLAAAAGGIDTLVFTAGIGENAAPIRARICEQSAWLGIDLDRDANLAGQPCISTPASRVAVWVIPTDEALMVARHTFALRP